MTTQNPNNTLELKRFSVNRNIQWVSILIGAILLMLYCFWHFSGTHITIVNQSGKMIELIEISILEKTYTIHDLENETQKSTRVIIKSDCSPEYRVVFQDGNESINNEGYLTNGMMFHKELIYIHQDGNISSTSF